MKKLLMTIGLCAILMISGISLAACGESQSPETYMINLPTSSDYTVESDKEYAEHGQKVTLTIKLLNNEIVIEDVFANETACEENYDGTFFFMMPAEDVTITITTNQLEEVLSTNFVWLDDDNLYTIATAGEGTFDGDTRDLNITFADKQGMTIIKSTISSSNQNVIPENAIEFSPVRDYDINGSSGSNQIVKGVVKINPFLINPGTSYLTMEFANGNNSTGISNRGTLVVKVTVVAYGELYFEPVKETLVIDLFSELQYQTGDTFCLRIGDSDHVDGSSNPVYVDYVLTMESGRRLTIEFDYILGHKFWIRLVEGKVQPDFQPGDIEQFVFEGGTIEGDKEGEYTGFYNNKLMYMEADDRVTIDAQRNPALDN